MRGRYKQLLKIHLKKRGSWWLMNQWLNWTALNAGHIPLSLLESASVTIFVRMWGAGLTYNSPPWDNLILLPRSSIAQDTDKAVTWDRNKAMMDPILPGCILTCQIIQTVACWGGVTSSVGWTKEKCYWHTTFLYAPRVCFSAEPMLIWESIEFVYSMSIIFETLNGRT